MKFPVPEFDGPTVVFGAPRSAYLTEEQMGRDHYGERTRHAKVASALFFSGGRLADHGLRFKAGIEPGTALAAIRALLCSFEPKHEIKIGTVAAYLEDWCEDYAAEKPQTPHQAQRVKRRKGKARVGRAA